MPNSVPDSAPDSATDNASGSVQVFAALGDETRLRLLGRLSEGPASLSALTKGEAVTRQAVTKHLTVLEKAGLVQCARLGRESIWRLERRRLEAARRFLDKVSQDWDDRLDRLRGFVED